MFYLVNVSIILEAVPKKVLEYVNLPGLKRENVASHLQVMVYFIELYDYAFIYIV